MQPSAALVERPIIPLTMDAQPHNGREGFRDPHTGLGGQVLLIHMCLTFSRVVAPVGRRWGKTTCLGFLFMEEAARTKGMYYAGVFEQDHAKAKAVMQVFITAYGGDPKKNPKSLVREIHLSEGQDRYFELRPLKIDGLPDVGNQGARIYFWSSKHPHYNAVRGIPHAFHRIVEDEAAMIRGECTTRVVLPMLLDVGGKLLVIGTPDVTGPGNYMFEQLWGRAISKDAKWSSWAGMNFPSDGNPHLSEEALAEQDKEYESDPVARVQEREGRFPDGIGGVWGNLSKFICLPPLPGIPRWVVLACKAARLDPEKLLCYFSDWAVHPGLTYVIGSDFARKIDSTVIEVFRCDDGRQVATFEIKGEDYEEQLDFLVEVRKHYGQTTSIQADGNGVGDGMCRTLLVRKNEDVTAHVWTGHNKETYVRQGVTLARTGGVKLINSPEQREQFRVFIGERNEKTGHIWYGAADGAHDDYVAAFLFCVEQLMVPMKAASAQEDAAGGIPPEDVEYAPGTYGALRQEIEDQAWIDIIGEGQI